MYLNRAVKNSVGVHNPKEAPLHRITEITSKAQADKFLPSLQVKLSFFLSFSCVPVIFMYTFFLDSRHVVLHNYFVFVCVNVLLVDYLYV